MTDWTALQPRAAAEFARRLDAVTDWDAPTPDVEWSVRDLVAHVTREQQWVPLLLAGVDATTPETALEPLGDDLVAAWHRHSGAAAEAWRTADHDAVVRLSTDEVTVAEYLAEQVADVTVHSWDLARAVGADERLDDDLVAAVWTVFEPQRDALEASSLFASPVPVAADAPLQVQLLALTGRDAR